MSRAMAAAATSAIAPASTAGFRKVSPESLSPWARRNCRTTTVERRSNSVTFRPHIEKAPSGIAGGAVAFFRVPWSMKQLRMPRPKIGIALGAGVARGWTHIGVLKALTRAGIDADIVAGTSIGALVGGCHVAGKLDPLEEFARSLTRRRMLSLLDFRFRSSGLIGDAKLAEDRKSTRLNSSHSQISYAVFCFKK